MFCRLPWIMLDLIGGSAARHGTGKPAQRWAVPNPTVRNTPNSTLEIITGHMTIVRKTLSRSRFKLFVLPARADVMAIHWDPTSNIGFLRQQSLALLHLIQLFRNAARWGPVLQDTRQPESSHEHIKSYVIDTRMQRITCNWVIVEWRDKQQVSVGVPMCRNVGYVRS